MANVDVLRQRFVEHAGANSEDTLPEHGALGATRFLTEHGVQAPEAVVQDFFDAQGWDSEFAASWDDMRDLAVALGVPDSRTLSRAPSPDAGPLSPAEAGEESCDSETELSAALATFIDEIAGRREKQIFPLVRPADLVGEEKQGEARHLLDLLRKTETVELQSFLDQKRAAFLGALPLTATTDVRKEDATHTYDTYYTYVCEYFAKTSLERDYFRHRMEDEKFLPLFPVASIGDAERKRTVQQAVNSICSEDIPALDEKLWRRWKEISPSALYSGKTEVDFFTAYLREEYFSLVLATVREKQEVAKACFQPKYAVSIGDVEEAIQRSRRQLLASACAEDETAALAAIEDRWAKTVASLSPGLSRVFTPAAFESFESDNYFDALRECVLSRGTKPTFQPKYDVDIGGADEAKRQSRQQLVARACVEDETAALAAIKERWTKTVAGLGPALSQVLTADAFESFEADNYFEVLLQCVESRGTASPDVKRPAEPTFQPKYAVNIGGADEAIRRSRQQLLASASAEDETAALAAIKERWTQMVAALGPALSRVLTPDAFESFEADHYFDALLECVESRSTVSPDVTRPAQERRIVCDFMPKYPVTLGSPSENILKQRNGILIEATCEAEQKALESIRLRWETMQASLAPSLRRALPHDAFAAFEADTYYDALQDAIQSRSAVQGAPRRPSTPKMCVDFDAMQRRFPQQVCPKRPLTPKVPVDWDANEEQQSKRQRILERLTQEDLNTVEELVRTEWRSKRDALPKSVIAYLPVEPSQEHWEMEYYRILLREFGVAKRPHYPESATCSDAAATQSSPLSLLPTIRGPLPSGHRVPAASIGMSSLIEQATCEVAELPGFAEEPELVGASSIMQGMCKGMSWKYEGFLLDYDASARALETREPLRSPNKRGGLTPPASCVLDLLLADKTGPLPVTLWHDVAEEFLQKLSQFRASALEPDSTAKPVVSLEIVRPTPISKNKWNGEILTTMFALHSVRPMANRPGTTLRLKDCADSYYLLDSIYVQPSPPATIVNFGAIAERLKVPFRATFTGTLTDVEELDYSQNGDLKRNFSLVDRAGSWIACTAFARNAQSSVLRDNAPVVLYYVTARPGLNGGKGSLWLFKDAAIVQVGNPATPAVKRTEVEVLAADG